MGLIPPTIARDAGWSNNPHGDGVVVSGGYRSGDIGVDDRVVLELDARHSGGRGRCITRAS